MCAKNVSHVSLAGEHLKGIRPVFLSLHDSFNIPCSCLVIIYILSAMLHENGLPKHDGLKYWNFGIFHPHIKSVPTNISNFDLNFEQLTKSYDLIHWIYAKNALAMDQFLVKHEPEVFELKFWL